MKFVRSIAFVIYVKLELQKTHKDMRVLQGLPFRLLKWTDSAIRSPLSLKFADRCIISGLNVYYICLMFPWADNLLLCRQGV